MRWIGSRTWNTGWVVIGASLFAVAVQAGEEIPVRDLPEAVVAHVRKAYPASKIVEAERKIRNQQMLYEVEIRFEHQQRELLYGADGSLIQVSVEIPVERTPAAVLAAAERDYPGMAIREVEQISRRGNTFFLLELGKWFRTVEEEYTDEGERVTSAAGERSASI